jgi:hypothetical protein
MDYNNNNTVQHNRCAGNHIRVYSRFTNPCGKIHLPATTTGSLPVPDYRHLLVFSTLPVPTDIFHPPCPVFIVFQYPASGNKWFSESMSGILGLDYRCLYPCGCPPAREPDPGYFTDKYPLREINHPAHNASLSKHTYPGYVKTVYILSSGNAPYGCPAARELYPGYSTNKYPLREIKHPAYPHRK